MIKKLWPLGVLLFVLLACHDRKGTQQNQQVKDAKSSYIPKYAKGFAIHYFDGYKELVIHNPWDQKAEAEHFYLVQATTVLSTLSAANGSVLNGPVKRWIPLSSTMVNYVDLLAKKSTICGVAESQYISDEYIQQQVKSGAIRDVGMAFSPDFEVIVDLEPDLVMVSPFKDNNFSALKSAGIPIITNADYLEHTPLGRAEWMVLVAALFDAEPQAQQLFNNIEKNYLEAKAKAASALEHPSVFTGHLYQGVWHTPAGESYMANFFKDAGVNYIYQNTTGTGSLSLDFESVFDKAHQSDYWLFIVNYPGEFSYEAFRKMDGRYADFKAFQQQNVIMTNASHSLFYEKGVLQPDVILNDMLHAFHPELDADYQSVYFYNLKQ